MVSVVFVTTKRRFSVSEEMAISYLTKENAETIHACVALVHEILYSSTALIESDDERVSQDNIENLILKLRHFPKATKGE